jgi:hypothetical protein
MVEPSGRPTSMPLEMRCFSMQGVLVEMKWLVHPESAMAREAVV